MNKFQDLAVFLVRAGYPSYRFKQISQSIFEQRQIDFNQMSFLPLDLRRELTEKFSPWLSIRAIKRNTSSKKAQKILFSLSDDKRIESVWLVYRNWQSVCLSSQVGCPLKCAFCATGKMGFSRNLTTDEIIDQLLFFNLEEEVDTVSFVGMGEPLLNDNLFEALGVITDKSLFNISPRKINVSTVGILPNLKRLIDNFPSVNIALSVNSPFPKQRQSLMPSEKKFPLEKIFPILNYHIRTNRRKVFLSYVLLSGINDSLRHALALARLIRSQGKPAYLYHVNLINFHPVAGSPFKASSLNQTNLFKTQLSKLGISVTRRRSLGLSFRGACGQLST